LSGVAAEDPLLRGILRSLGVAMGEVVFAAEAGETTPALPPLHFGKSGMDVPSLPGLALLRADPRAKRTAWQETLRPLAGRMRKS